MQPTWVPSQRRSTRAVLVRAVEEDEDLDDDVAQFLKAQDASERGFDPRANLDEVVGADEVDEEQAKALCRDVTRIIKLLKENRDMELREAKLILQIDDPRNDDARKMGVEDSRGVSRDEMALALEEVAAGKLPTDRIALRLLHGEMTNWPFLENDASVKPPDTVEIKAPPPGAAPCATCIHACVHIAGRTATARKYPRFSGSLCAAGPAVLGTAAALRALCSGAHAPSSRSAERVERDARLARPVNHKEHAASYLSGWTK